MTFDIREHIEQLEVNPKDKSKYFCPACGGHNLSISLQTGAYNCWADDSEGHRALIRENLSPTELKPTRPSPGTREWTYRTIDLRPVIQVKRIDAADQDKRVWRPSEVEELKAEVVPLFWHECMEQYEQEGGRVFIVEGEMCAEELRAIGLNAITFVGGSTGYKKELYYDLLFQIREALVLVPDMDKPGVKLMDSICSDFPDALWCYVQGPNYYYWGADRLPDKGGYDIADAVRNGATVERILQWIHRKQSFALTGQALEADVEVNDMLNSLLRVYSESVDVGIREIKVGQYLKKSGLKDLGWTIRRAITYCADAQTNQGGIQVIDAHELIHIPTKRPRWIIPGFLPAGSVILLGASGGTGKTTFCYNIAKNIALGGEWSDFPVVQGKVLIISTDEPSHDTKEKLQTIDYASVPRGMVNFIRFWRFSQVDQLEEIIKRMEPTLIIIDSLTSTTAGIHADRTSSSAGDCLYELRDIAERYECTFMILHHLNKQGTFRDSTTYVDNVSEAWKLTKDENQGDFILEYEKSRNSFQGKAILRRRLEQYQWTLIGRVGSSVSWDVEQRVARYVNERIKVDGVEHWLTAEQIAARCGQSCTPTEVHSALPLLRLTGRVSCDTEIVGGMTVRRYAAWDAKAVATAPSNVIPVRFEASGTTPLAGPVEIEPELVDDYDEILVMIREAMNLGRPPEQMTQMLETYPWPKDAKALFWSLLDGDMKLWLKPKQKRA